MAALHGDPRMHDIVAALLTRHGVRTVIETGTFRGDSTAWFAQRVPEVVTIEARPDFYATAVARLSAHRNVRAICGDSAAHFGAQLFAVLRAHAEPVLCFLDGHWQDAWPLHDELRELESARCAYGDRLIVIADDLRVPGHPNFQGCDGGGGTVGDPTYGPKTFAGGHPADIGGFPELREWPELWWPGYPGIHAGYAIAADFPLDVENLPVWRDQG